MKTFISTKELRETHVQHLTAEECGRLLVHHHGGKLTEARRKAYLLKHAGENWPAFFNATEASVIQATIEAGI